MSDQLRAQYDSLYKNYDDIYRAGKPNQIVTELATYVSSGSVLDLGGGEGVTAVYLAKRGFRVTVIDFSSEGLKKADSRASKQRVSLKSIPADILTHEPEDTFDVVIISHVLHQYDQLQAEAVLKKMQRITKTNGINIIITYSDCGGLFERSTKTKKERYYPNSESLLAAYGDWQVLKIDEHEEETLAKDRAGFPMKNRVVALMVKKIGLELFAD